MTIFKTIAFGAFLAFGLMTAAQACDGHDRDDGQESAPQEQTQQDGD